MNTSKRYPSDLSDEQWKEIEPLIPKAKTGGRKRTSDMRLILNAILYLLRSGCSWRMLPNDLPPWGTVHYYFRRFRIDGVWEKVHDRLREEVRMNAGKNRNPSAGIIDSQSVKTSEKGGFVDMMLAKKSMVEKGI